jgi:tRNA-guanine family transglycosylase
MLAATLLSIHNLHTLISLAEDIRQSILKGQFNKFVDHFEQKKAEAESAFSSVYESE